MKSSNGSAYSIESEDGCFSIIIEQMEQSYVRRVVRTADDVKLTRFLGRPKDLTPKAYFKSFLG